jgi:hypothetical protein
MKIILSLLSVLLLACTAPKTKIPTGILSEKEFANILKEVHLAEAALKLNKREGIKSAKNSFSNSCQSIYKTYDISATTFRNSLKYYAKHPAILEAIYSTVLQELDYDLTALNHKETN